MLCRIDLSRMFWGSSIHTQKRIPQKYKSNLYLQYIPLVNILAKLYVSRGLILDCPPVLLSDLGTTVINEQYV